VFSGKFNLITRARIFSSPQVLLFLLLFFFTFYLSPFANQSFANPLDYYGYGSRASAMGNAYTALATDFTGVYYNPAAMVMTEKASFGLGFSYYNIGLSTSDLAKNDQASDLKNIDPLYGYTLGFCLPLKGKLRGKAAFGLGTYFLGDWYYIKARSPELNEPEFVIDQIRNRRQEVALGVAYRPLKMFSFGLGAYIIPGGSGSSTMTLDVPILQGKSGAYPPTFTVDWDITTKIAFLGGIHFQLNDRLAAGINFRDKIDMLFSIPVDMYLTNLGLVILEEQNANTHIISHVSYTPRHVNLGVYYSPLPRLKLSGDLFWYEWSGYPNPAPTLKISSKMKEGDLLAGILKTPDIPANPSPGFHDTFSPNLGAEYQLIPAVALRGGYSFVPTPVPAQTGASNFLDMDRHILTLGTGISFQDPFAVFSKKILMDLHFQYHILAGQTIKKDTGLPAAYNDWTNRIYPYSMEYKMSGGIYGGGITFHLTL
jgi:long-chain fatty acid transport protein